jgi:hypothetical protein
MKLTILLLFSAALFPSHAIGDDTVYKCKKGDHYAYQSAPCDQGTTVQKIKPKTIKPDLATLERLEQHLDYLKRSNLAEYHRLRREKLSPAERSADERLEEQERLQQRQAELELQQRERHQQESMREMETRRLQELQLEQERLALDRQRLMQQREILLPAPFYPPVNTPMTPHPHRHPFLNHITHFTLKRPNKSHSP